MNPDPSAEQRRDLTPTVDPFATDITDNPDLRRKLGRYRLLDQLGRGGMGIVYEAEPIDGGPHVALKTLQSGTAASLARLKGEFRVVSDLAHPNLVQLGELDTTDSEPFFTMEIVRGTSFDQYVRSSFETAAATPGVAYADSRLRESLAQLAEGLHALHQAGLVHRDIKPSNVMVTPEGRVVILDMGLTVDSELLKVDGDQTALAGTPYYMSPEQTRGEAVTPASDWFSVGVMLFESLTGERAFHSRQLTALLTEKMNASRLGPKDLSNSIPSDLDSLCRGLMQPQPEDRPQGHDILRIVRGAHTARIESSVWIGRQEEMKVLQDCWQRVREGMTSVVMVSGSSGMGKTSLVDRFLTDLRRSETVVILRGRCYENEAVPYRGFDSVVDSLAAYLQRLPRAEVERVLPLDLDALCQLFPVIKSISTGAHTGPARSPRHGDPREQSLRGIAALRELLCRLSRFVSVVIFIDDLQQGDDDTAAVFRELFRHDEAPTSMFIATFRSEEAETNSCLRRVRRCQLPPGEQQLLAEQTEISVDRLSRSDSLRLAAKMLGETISERDPEVLRIANEADGDPLFIRMLADHRIRNAATVDPQSNSTETRWTLASVIRDRLDELAANERDAVDLLASAGRPVGADDLEGLVDAGRQSLGLIRSLRVKRLIRRLGDLRQVELYHDKIRETALHLMPENRLRKNCLAIARRIDRREQDRDVEFLADLYRRGGDEKNAGQYYQAAAFKSESMFAFFRAIEFYRYAIELLKPDGEQAQRLHRGLGDSLANSSRSTEAAEQYLAAADHADSRQRLELTQLAAMRYLTSGHVEAGTVLLRNVLDQSQLSWPQNRLLAVAGLLRRMLWLRIRGLRAKEHQSPDPTQRQKLDACWSAAAGLSLVDPLRGCYYITETLCRSLRIGCTDTLPRDLAAYMSQVAIGGTRSRRATHRVLIACRALPRREIDPYRNAMQFLSRGIAALLRGQWKPALRCCDLAVQYLHDPSCTDKTWELNTARTFGLWALQYQGNLIELSRRQPDLLKIAQASGDLFATLNFGTQVMAHLQLAGDQPEESLRRLEEDKARLSDRGFFIQHHNYLLAKTYTLLYQGRGCDALKVVDGQWQNYRRELLSQIQQVRIDHRQVLVRALIAAAGEGYQVARCLARARKLIKALRRERSGWGTALSTVFEAACERLDSPSNFDDHRLTEAIRLLEKVDMRLFAAAAAHHRAVITGTRVAEPHLKWSSVGVACGSRMARMLIPGMPEAQGSDDSP
jgi:serine/threonine protein kinase/tetratricopeptide (TPR) repeat protein